MITTEMTKMYLTGLSHGEEQELEIRLEKFIIGSGPTTHLQLTDQSISDYHAFVSLLDSERILVKDLDSTYGVFFNGQKVKECIVAHGDILTLGSLSFRMQVELQRAVTVKNSNPARSLSDLIFIDGEYCDIIFDDSTYKPRTDLMSFEVDSEYIDLDDLAPVEKTSFSTEAKQLEIVNYVNGLVLDVTYLMLKDGDYYLGPQKDAGNVIQFNTLGRLKFFNIKDSNLTFYSRPELESNLLEDLGKEARFFTHGTEQISVRLVDKSIKFAPVSRFDSQFKSIVLLFIFLFFPSLMLTLIDFEKPQMKEAEVAVIYKLPDEPKIEPQEKVEVAQAPEKVTEQKDKSGVSPDAGKIELTGAQNLAANTKPVKKTEIAKSQSKTSAETVAAPAGVKGYTFKSNVALDLATSAPKMAAIENNKKAQTDTSFSISGSDQKTSVSAPNIGVSKFNTGKNRTEGKTYGAKGLIAKSGFDSSYVEPKRVNMNSMDPELVKKIIREYIPQFRHCYQQELITRSDKVKGIINMNFRIGADGKVTKHDINTADSSFSKKGTDCMARVLSLIDFPRPKGGGIVDIRQPLNFTTEGQI